MDFATVFRTFQLAEAQLVRSRLDVAGIPATVVNENAALAVTGYGTPAIEICVQVPSAQAADALALLAAPPASE
jgi:hypothetical protein